VSEWQGQKEGERDIKVRMDIRKKSLLIFLPGQARPTRTIDCKRTDRLYAKESVDKARNFLLIRIPNEYDLVRCKYLHCKGNKN